MDTNTERKTLAATILAGLCANPAIIAPNGMSGWSLVNCTDADLAGYAMSLADKVIDAEFQTRTQPHKTNARPLICAENHRPD